MEALAKGNQTPRCVPVCRGRYEHTQPTPRAPALHGCTCLGGAREREALNRGFETCASETWKRTRGFTSVSSAEARGNEAVSHCEPNDTHTSSFTTTGTLTPGLPRRRRSPRRARRTPGPRPHACLGSPSPSSRAALPGKSGKGAAPAVASPPPAQTGPSTRNQSWAGLSSTLTQAGSNGWKTLAAGSPYSSTGKSRRQKQGHFVLCSCTERIQEQLEQLGKLCLASKGCSCRSFVAAAYCLPITM